jgi:hypothetical protein
MNLKGKDYMLVAHRLLWFVNDVKSYTIDTHFPALDQEHATAQVTVTFWMTRKISFAAQPPTKPKQKPILMISLRKLKLALSDVLLLLLDMEQRKLLPISKKENVSLMLLSKLCLA